MLPVRVQKASLRQPTLQSDNGEPSKELANTKEEPILFLEDALKVLGIENMSIVYNNLERLGVKKEDIPSKPVEFGKALRIIFGQGALILEMQIISSIAAKTGRTYESDMTLVQVLESLKKTSEAN